MNRMIGGARDRGMRSGRWLAGLATLALLAAAGIARADDGGQQTRAVRLSYVQGQVQISQGNQAISSQAAANMPLFEGYQITTGQDGQAEIQFEDGSVARIAPDSGLTLSILRGQGSNGEAEIVLNGGLAYFELQGGDQAGRIDVRLGDAVVTAAGFTVMRIDTDTPPGALAIFSGNAHVVQGDALSLDLHGNESVTLNASNPSQYNLAETVESNSWDQWNSDRDQAMQAEAGTQTQATDNFVNNENPAWNDLNANGNWYNMPGQGYVWSPYVAANAGWDPYGCGQWMWMPPYGYIWVSCQSWGYMPYACGTWNFYSSFGWGWSPGMGGCNPWWRNGYGGGGYAGYYGGPNIGTAPSGYRPVIRPPTVLHPPKGRFPRPVVVDRMPRTFSGAPLRQINAPVMIAGHSVEPLRPIVARTGPAQPAPRTFVGGMERGGAAGTGGEARMPQPIVAGRQSNPSEPRTGPRTPANEGYQQPQRYTPPATGYHTQPSRGYQPPPAAAGRGYQPPPAARGYEPPANRGYQPPSGARSEPPRTYSPPARSYSPPPARSEAPPSRGPSGGGYSGGGGFHGGGNPGGGGFHGGGAPAGGGGGASHAGGGGGGHR